MLCVGPAGEKGSFFATIEATGGASASRTAPGAVMGSKNLKAIVVRGRKDINVADGARLVELSEQILSRTGPLRERWLDKFLPSVTTDLVTLHLWAMSHYSGAVNPEVQQRVKEKLHEEAFGFSGRFTTRLAGCYNCGIGCRRLFHDPQSKGFVTAKCQAFSAFILHTQIINFDLALKYYSLCRRYGMDDMSLSYTLSFAIDLYRRGILTDKDTDGLHLEWGNPEVVFALLDKIIRREGIGDVLANGAFKAAQIIGRGAEEFVYTIKKLEPLPADFTGRPIYILPQAISDKIDRTRALNGTSFQIWRWPKKEDREEYLKSVFWGYPEGQNFEKYFLDGYDPTGVNYEPLCQFTAYDDETLSLLDSTGGCYYWQMFLSHPPIAKRSLTAELITATTGVNFDYARTTDTARRITNLVRSYNLRSGMTRKDDSLTCPH
jgi:aldehyde:ferredoxin oxidoreductase